MTRKQKLIRTAITMAVTVLMTIVVLWLRSDDEFASSVARIEYMGITYSVTDLFVILTAGICGYQYGIIVFLAALFVQTIQNGGIIDGLFSLLIYFVISIVAGYFAEKRWYRKIWKSVLALIYFTLILGGSWYIMFIQLYSFDNAYTNMELWQLCLGAVPEVFVAVLFQYLFFRFVPDKCKKYIGKCYVYTKEYENSAEFLESGHSVLKKQVTAMTMPEAILLSVFAVILSNAQMNQISRIQRERIYQQRTISLSDEQISDISGTGDTQTEVSSTADDPSDTAEQTTEEVPSDRPDFVPPDGDMPGRYFELSDDQLNNISDNFAVRDRDLIVMDIQLGLIVMCIAMPLGLFFNSLMVRRVVVPIRTLSSVMNDYFNEEEQKRPELLEKLRSMKTQGKDNEINQLNYSMQRMIGDMTEYINAVRHEKELESELKVAEARSEAKSVFLSNMSHEIRTPINAILGMNEMILRETAEPSTVEYAENVRNAGNTLLGLVNDILDFSKIEAGKMDIIPVDYDLSSVLNDLVTMIQTRADNKGLELIVNVDPEIPVQLHGDEIRIKQVATNVLTNAVKYTEKGSVSISVGYEPLPEENGKRMIGLSFKVSDTGIGIKQEDMSKLFSAFERIEEERNRTIEGTGLGMNITRRLLDMMGSKLEVESEYGKGSTFSFTVKQEVMSDQPIGNYEESYRRTLADRRKYKEKFTAPEAQVLVVDDTKMNLSVFRSLLKKTLVQIDTAASGDECIEKTKEKKYDIIFLDHRMPVKDGIETLQELLADKENPNTATPAVCLTANAVSGAREMYISAGFTDYLTKPIDPDHLEAVLIKYLPGEKVHTVSADAQPAGEPDNEQYNGAVPEWLHEISALDIDEGIRHCGDEEIYMETLGVYAEGASEGADEIGRLWAERDIENVTVKVHALKSTSRVVGAMQLGSFAERMEKAGNDGDIEILEENMNKLIADYRALGEALSPLVKASDEDESLPEMPAEKLREAYDAVREIAEVFDYDSVLFVMGSLEGYRAPESERERLAALKAAVAKPDWDMIKKIVSE